MPPSRTTRPPAVGGPHELPNGNQTLWRRHERPGASPYHHRRALAGFLAASSFEHCGPRLLSMAIGVGLVALAAGSVAARIMRFDAFGAIVFIILAALFVMVAGPMMDQCRAWILGSTMMNDRTQQIRTALAFVIGAALIDRVFLHLLDITPAALIACVLIAVTLAAEDEGPAT